MSPVFRHGSLRLYLLRLLDEEPRHGYEVIRLLRDRFMGVYSPSPGTIYPRLARLEEEGLVTHDEVDGRKVYRITEAGREELRSRSDELDELEEELSASVSDIVREVREDVRQTVRSLREELTRAARESRRTGRDMGAEAREQARQARDEAGSRPGRPADEAREEARQAARRPGRPTREPRNRPGRRARMPSRPPGARSRPGRLQDAGGRPGTRVLRTSGAAGRGRARFLDRTRPGGCASMRAGCGRKRSGSARRRARGSPPASRTGSTAGLDGTSQLDGVARAARLGRVDPDARAARLDRGAGLRDPEGPGAGGGPVHF